MVKLILLRHLKSQWNLENRFTGWTDIPLARESLSRAKEIGLKIFGPGGNIDVIYSSPLFRNQDTVARILYYYTKYPVFIHLDKGRMRDWGYFKEINKNYIPVYISQDLNERYYGKLQGLDKSEIMRKYGSEKVHLWRRGFKNTPPGGESLKDTYKRAVPFFKKYIETNIGEKKNVLVVASHNSLRAIIKYIEKISDKDIINLEVPYGGVITYDFDESLKFKEKKIL